MSSRMKSETDFVVVEDQNDDITSSSSSSSSNSKPNYSWEDLNRIENKRRSIMTQVDLPFWIILSKTAGTCLHNLTRQSMIWLPLLIYVAIRLRVLLGRDDDLVEFINLTDTDLSILGGFLTFLLVLFVNQTNTRFWEMYLLARSCAGRIQDIAGLAVVQLPRKEAQRLVKHLNAAHIAGYLGLPRSPYTKSNFFDIINNENQLLNSHELARLEPLGMDTSPAPYKELITWCQRNIADARKAGYIDSIEATEMHKRVLAFRAAMDGIHDYCDQPPHFYYIHFLCLLTALYLPLFAVDNAYNVGSQENSDWSKEVITGVIVFLQSVFVVGLRLLGQRMLNPMGDDYEDLSVIEYVCNAAIGNSRYILAYHWPEAEGA